MTKKIAVIVGSDSDLKGQCKPGLQYLLAQAVESVSVVGVYTYSAHRNTDELLDLVAELAQDEVDVIIAGAGWANALTGLCDAYLRYYLQDSDVVVIGVAFEDSENIQHAFAAHLSITELPPGNKVAYDKYVGEEGFLRACRFAVEGNMPVITLPEKRPSHQRTIQEALEL